MGGIFFEIPHVVPGCEILGPGVVFRWHGPFPWRLFDTHSQAKHFVSTSHASQQSPQLLALVHRKAVCVHEMSG
eukprot:SAG11_NODE_25041_length_364_cov_1.147170_1_plen_73_part_10